MVVYLFCLVYTVNGSHFTVLVRAKHFTHRASGNAAGQAVDVDFLAFMDLTRWLVSLALRRWSAAVTSTIRDQ